MAVSVEEQQKDPILEPPIIDEEDEEPSDDDDEDDDDDDEDFDEEEEEEEENLTEESRMRSERAKMENLFISISRKRVPMRVHRVLIKGSTKTNDSLIEVEIEQLRHATTMQDLLRAAATANARLQSLEIFDSVNITLDSGPPELPATANVIVEVVETKKPLTGEIGFFSKPEEFDLRYAFPLGFYHAALNFGISGGVIFPWGSGFLNMPSYIRERFFLGGNSSPICTLGGPKTLLGFKSREVGATDLRRQIRDNSNDESSDTPGRDFFGGDLALTSFVDLSFDLPSRVLREAGIHGHVFACAGNLTKLTENAFKDFSFQKFQESFRSSTGFGIVVPTKLFRMEVNYCYILKQLEHDRGKTGVQFSFSSP